MAIGKFMNRNVFHFFNPEGFGRMCRGIFGI